MTEYNNSDIYFLSVTLNNSWNGFARFVSTLIQTYLTVIDYNVFTAQKILGSKKWYSLPLLEQLTTYGIELRALDYKVSDYGFVSPKEQVL